MYYVRYIISEQFIINIDSVCQQRLYVTRPVFQGAQDTPAGAPALLPPLPLPLRLQQEPGSQILLQPDSKNCAGSRPALGATHVDANYYTCSILGSQ